MIYLKKYENFEGVSFNPEVISNTTFDSLKKSQMGIGIPKIILINLIRNSKGLGIDGHWSEHTPSNFTKIISHYGNFKAFDKYLCASQTRIMYYQRNFDEDIILFTIDYGLRNWEDIKELDFKEDKKIYGYMEYEDLEAMSLNPMLWFNFRNQVIEDDLKKILKSDENN